jgi:hypothetical protein
MNRSNKPCEEYVDRIALMTSGDLAGEELAAVMRHLSECGSCRAYWQDLQGDHRAMTLLSRSLQGNVQSLEKRVIDRIMSGGESDTAGGHRWWRWIMHTRSGRLVTAATSAAIIVIVVLVLQTMTASFNAWAEVLEKAINTTSCRLRVTNMDNPAHNSITVFSDIGFSTSVFEDGRNVESMYVDYTGKTVVHMIPPLKRAVSMKLGDDLLRVYVEKDPRQFFMLAREADHEDLGSRVINDRKVVGIRTKGENPIPELMDEAEFEIWADPDTKWPVMIEVRGGSADGTFTKHVRFDDFVWNISLTEKDFQPHIPDDYELISGIEMEISEEHAIKGLRAFARVTGKYPSALAYTQATMEMWKLIGKRVLSSEVLPVVHQMRATCEFQGKLARDDSDVLYFGDRVRPGDSDHVLMRWRMGEDRYRVLFGDLRAETVGAEELIDLESR